MMEIMLMVMNMLLMVLMNISIRTAMTVAVMIVPTTTDMMIQTIIYHVVVELRAATCHKKNTLTSLTRTTPER